MFNLVPSPLDHYRPGYYSYLFIVGSWFLIYFLQAMLNVKWDAYNFSLSIVGDL